MRIIALILIVAGTMAAEDPAVLVRAGLDALNNEHYTTAVSFLKRAVDLEPTHRWAWNSLGRAYLALDQVDAAMEAFHKQIDNDPRCPNVYQNLGQALLRTGKRESNVPPCELQYADQ